MILTKRDRHILLTVARFRLALGRQIKALCGFNGQRAMDRRLKLLIENGYMTRNRVIYGVAGIYNITAKAKKELDIPLPISKQRLDQIAHDIAVIDTAIYLIQAGETTLAQIQTEKELRHKQGFSNRGHEPDFIYTKGGQTICVEAELSLKAKDRLMKNLKNNYLKYDVQKWVIPEHKQAIYEIVSKAGVEYPNIEIVSLETVRSAIKEGAGDIE